MDGLRNEIPVYLSLPGALEEDLNYSIAASLGSLVKAVAIVMNQQASQPVRLVFDGTMRFVANNKRALECAVPS